MKTPLITLAIPDAQSLPPSLLSNIETGFKSAFEQAEKWRNQALSIQVTSFDQKAEMKLARTIRLELKNIRVSAEKTRKALKEDSLRMGKAIDGVYNILDAAIVPLERHLQEQEDYAERLAAAERLRIGNERAEAIAPYLDTGSVVPQLADMTPEQWRSYFEDAKILCAAKIESARKAEAERIERERIEAEERAKREAAEAAERARIRAENEKLKAEREAAEIAARAEREAAQAEVRRIAENNRKEREAIEAKARAEREEIEAKAKAEREAAEKEIARIKAEADKAAKLEAERQAYEASKQKAAADAAKKAARAPDKQKALAFAATVRALKAPEASTSEGKAVMAEITAKIEGFAKWIEAQASAI